MSHGPASKPRGLRGPRRIWAVGVIAATSRIVRQATRGEWESVTFTVHQRRRLLDRLSGGIPELRGAARCRSKPGHRAEANCTELSCIEALRQAVAESDALIALLNEVGTATARGARHV
jgi:hypothetical protein